MKAHTSGFKEEVKMLGRQLDSIITYELDGVTHTLSAEEINSVTPTFSSNILKSAMKELDIDVNVDIPPKTVVNYKFGVLVGEEYEYLNYGNYIVYSSEKQEDTNSYKIICYDKMLNSMKDYEALDIEYPIAVREYIDAICKKIGLVFANKEDTFANYDKEIPNELYLDSNGNILGYTYRDVLDELAQVTASTICINEETDELEIRYINDTEDTIDEEYLKDVNVTFGEKYGPINSIVLSRGAESDNIYLQDEESIEQNGLCELKISDNQIMNFNNRDEFLPDILEKLDCLEYYINDFSSTGITYYDLCDRYNILIGDTTYSCIMLNDEINVTQGLEENVYTKEMEESETDYNKSDKTDRRINQTWLIVNKQERQIEALTSRVEEIDDTYSQEQINRLIQNAETGLTNTFSTTGGNNIFRNTSLAFVDNSQDKKSDYEFWEGTLQKGTEEKAVSGTCILIQNGTCRQSQVVVNGDYTISFKYKKIINLSHAKVYINNVAYILDDETNEKEFELVLNVTTQIIDIKFECDTDNGYAIYDLMVNAGTTKAVYVQNQNETTTSTVNISKGIEIINSNINSRTRLDADGKRTYNTVTNELTNWDTEQGSGTNELYVKNKAEITKVVFSRVGNQSWLSSIGGGY